ncbi:hypothetical protein EXIGLDRAFT_736466 [Exidia glandulosa HHB12029]|uniref:Uncharacterized protein n=1 Tax=Exidia glandulosa HHB12029 TaxID=1314781 RepID=A0A165JE90_EXIGL|nr:hypothetical protein EXIGLDRAFT_736466 [Exidia glandulosa HHB12029]
MPPNAESTLALLDEENQSIVLWSTPRYEETDVLSTRAMILHALNAFAHICVTDPTTDSYAAALYKTDKQNLTLLLSGFGPIPDATRENVTKVVSLLKVAAAHDSPASDAVLENLFTTLSLLGSENWRRQAYPQCQGIWDGRIESVRRMLAGDSDDLEKFNEVVRHLEELKKYATTFKDLQASSGGSSAVDAHITARTLNRLLQEERIRDVLACKVDWMHSGYATRIRLLKHGAPVLDDRSQVETSEGCLRHDFSISYFAVNLLGYYRCAAYLTRLFTKGRGHLDRLEVVFCPSVKRSVPIDVESAKLALSALDGETGVLHTRTDTTATGFLHPVTNLLEQLLIATSRSSRTAVIMPAIGTSCLVCAGCDAFLQAYNYSHSRHASVPLKRKWRTWPDVQFEYAGTTGVFVFSWLAPDVRPSPRVLHRRRRRIYEALHAFLRNRTNQLLVNELVGIYSGRAYARVIAERARLDREEEAEEQRKAIESAIVASKS